MIDFDDPIVVEAIAAFGDAAGLPVSFPCDIDPEPHCGLGSNGLSCSLPAGHLERLHSWEDPVHAARVESFLDRQDAARGTT